MRVAANLERAFERLAAHPGMGHVREDLTSVADVLFWPVGPTLIAYRSDGAGVEVLLVERGELDWTTLLGEGAS